MPKPSLAHAVRGEILSHPLSGPFWLLSFSDFLFLPCLNSGYTDEALGVLTGRRKAYGYWHTERFLTRLAHTGGADELTNALGKWTTTLWQSMQEAERLRDTTAPPGASLSATFHLLWLASRLNCWMKRLPIRKPTLHQRRCMRFVRCKREAAAREANTALRPRVMISASRAWACSSAWLGLETSPAKYCAIWRPSTMPRLAPSPWEGAMG